MVEANNPKQKPTIDLRKVDLFLVAEFPFSKSGCVSSMFESFVFVVLYVQAIFRDTCENNCMFVNGNKLSNLKINKKFIAN